jgi:hypothetical protein
VQIYKYYHLPNNGLKEEIMTKLLGKDAYEAARNQTIKKLNPMKQAFIAVAKQASTANQSQDSAPATDKTESNECKP